jgi:non-ribosomal peptide synthetase component F
MPPAFIPLEQQVSQCDLSVTIGEVDGTLSGLMQYNAGLFDPATITRMRRHYQMLLDRVVADPTRRLAASLTVLDSN